MKPQRNDQLRQARLRVPSPSRPGQPMSREELADAVNAYLFRETQRVFDMDANHIGKYELGEYRWPRAHYRDALRAVLRVGSDTELGFYPKRGMREEFATPPEAPPCHPPVATSARSEDDRNQVSALPRRGILSGLAAIGVVGWGRPTQAESFRHAVALAVNGRDRPDLAEWEGITAEYGTAYPTTGPAELLEDLSIDLTIAERHLGRLRRPMEQRTMCRVISQLTGLVAHTLSDLGNPRASIRWWRTANQAAEASGDPRVRTWVLGREIIHGIYDRRPPQTLLDIADRACAITISPFVGLAIVYAGRAQTLAMLGRSSDATAALDMVRRISDKLPIRPTDDPLSVFGWSEVRLRHTESFVYTFLGDLPRAATAQLAAIALYPDPHSADCSEVRLHQALCMVRGGNVTSGVQHALSVLSRLPEPHRRDMVLEVARHVARAVPVSHLRRPETEELRQVLGLPPATTHPAADDPGTPSGVDRDATIDPTVTTVPTVTIVPTTAAISATTVIPASPITGISQSPEPRS